MIGLLVRLLSRFAFRFFLTILIFAIGNLLGGRQRDSSKGFRRFGGGSGEPGGSGGDSGRRSGSGGARTGSRPPLNRGDAVDVPFTEVPPAGESAAPSKPAGEAGRGS
jgi:hypothetical protein